jgi:hypothetical protein
VRLTAHAAAGLAGTYVRFGRKAATRYSKPLLLTRAQLSSLRFQSLDRLGRWEHPRRAAVPRR